MRLIFLALFLSSPPSQIALPQLLPAAALTRALNAALILLVVSWLAAATPAAAQATRFPGGEGIRTLDTSGHPKAKGLELQVSFPQSWAIEEAKRPNSVAIATSEGGRGLESCVIGVHTTQQLGWPAGRARGETVRSFTEPTRLRQVAADMQADYLDGGPANLEGLPARWVASVPKVSRDGSDVVFPSVTYQVLLQYWMLSLTCGTGARSREAALTRFKQQELLFRLIANSMVLPQRWR